MTNIDTYLSNIRDSQRAAFERIDAIVKDLVPEAEVTISYGIPTWKYKGKFVLYFAAYKDHMSIHPASMELLDELQDELGDFKINNDTRKAAGTIQFSEENFVPEVVVRTIVTRRLQAINDMPRT